MSGAASPFDAGNVQSPRARPRPPRTRIMARATEWQPTRLSAAELPMSRTDHGPFLDARGGLVRLAADPRGLSVVGGRADIEWSAVTGFVCRAYDSRRTGHGMRYSVLAGRDAITWDLPAAADASMRQEHERLCQLVVSRTGLLLIEEGVVAPVWPVEMRSGRAVALPFADDNTPARAEPLPIRRRSRYRVLRTVGMLLILLALIAAVAYGTATVLAHLGAQSVSPSTLASSVKGSTSVYYDALNLADGDWPVGVLPGTGAMASFASHAYVLAAKTQPAAALAPGAYGSGALEVTVGGPRGAGEAGLALRASADGRILLAFAVSSAGRWMLQRGTPSSAGSSTRILGSGATGVIQRGATATNTLLIIPRGPRYLCYVNGHYVGSVTLQPADTGGLPAPGRAGVWVAAGTSAGFTSFAVYPAA